MTYYTVNFRTTTEKYMKISSSVENAKTRLAEFELEHAGKPYAGEITRWDNDTNGDQKNLVEWCSN